MRMKSIGWILALMVVAAVGWRIMVGVIRAADSESKDTAMQLTSSAFEPGQPIPKQFTADGENISPPLAWSQLPDDAQSLALIVDDPDAPGKQPWVHWVAFNIDSATGQLPQAVPHKPQVEEPKIIQGVNSFSSDNIGYRGPVPPRGHGVHHYHFHLYALNATLDLPPGNKTDKQALLHAMRGHVIGECQLVGTYERK